MTKRKKKERREIFDMKQHGQLQSYHPQPQPLEHFRYNANDGRACLVNCYQLNEVSFMREVAGFKNML